MGPRASLKQTLEWKESNYGLLQATLESFAGDANISVVIFQLIKRKKGLKHLKITTSVLLHVELQKYFPF